ncbi:MAG: stage III sporulation protein AE [Anaerovorax sp.]|nr:stage III sporulation protein AE [Anaerovorax sp.]
MENLINEQLSSMNLEQLQELMGMANSQGQIFENRSVMEIIQSLIKGEPFFQWDQLLSRISEIFFIEIRSAIFLAVQILLICMVVNLLQNMASSFGEHTVSKMGSMICSCVVATLCLRNFIDVYNLCSIAVTQMVSAMQILLPILVPLMIATGSITSGGILNPVILAAITLLSKIMEQLILPAIFLSCIFLLVNSLSDKDYIKKLAGFLRGFAIFLMGLSVTLFSGLTAIQGLATESADTMLIKTARFSVDHFIPIIGGFAADSMDMILSCTKMIKNGIGVFGLILILTILLIPLLKLVAIAIVYKVVAVIAEPIGSKRIAVCMDEIGNTIITLAVVLLLGAILFLIFISILIAMGTM